MLISTPIHSPDLPSTWPIYLHAALRRALGWAGVEVAEPDEEDGATYITHGIPIRKDIPLLLSCGTQSSSSASSSFEPVTDIDGNRGGGSKADAG